MLSAENLIKIWCNKINHYNKMKMKIGFPSLLLQLTALQYSIQWVSKARKINNKRRRSGIRELDWRSVETETTYWGYFASVSQGYVDDVMLIKMSEVP